MVSPKDLEKPNGIMILLLWTKMLLRGWRDLDKPNGPAVNLLTLQCWNLQKPNGLVAVLLRTTINVEGTEGPRGSKWHGGHTWRHWVSLDPKILWKHMAFGWLYCEQVVTRTRCTQSFHTWSNILYTSVCEKDLSARSLEASSMLQSTHVYNVSTSINLKENPHFFYKVWFQANARAFVKTNFFRDYNFCGLAFCGKMAAWMEGLCWPWSF